jgi:excisionase family DNA binding protein
MVEARRMIDDLLSEFAFADAGRSKAVAVSAMVGLYAAALGSAWSAWSAWYSRDAIAAFERRAVAGEFSEAHKAPARRKIESVVLGASMDRRMSQESGRILLDPTISSDEAQLLTKGELARRLRVSARTVDNWMRSRRIPFIKAGKTVRFYWADVFEKLQKFRVN